MMAGKLEPALFEDGEIREFNGLMFRAINGIVVLRRREKRGIWSLLMERAYNISRQCIPIPGTSCIDSHDNNSRALIYCADPDCIGKTGPNGYVCCRNDDDCKNAKATCDNKGYTARYARCSENNECSYCDYCKLNSDCLDGYCCPYEIDNGNYAETTGDKQCKPKGIIINWKGKSYICDPINEIKSNENKGNFISPILQALQNIISSITSSLSSLRI